MLSGQAGDFRQCIRGFAIALAHTSAQCPRQDLLVGRCSDIHKDRFTQQDACEASRARKYFLRQDLRHAHKYKGPSADRLAPGL